MTPARKKRLAIVGGILLGVAAATVIATQAFEDNLLYFYDPSQIVAGEAPADKKFRIGGLVQPGSLERTPGSLEIRFTVTDNAHAMKVAYSGLLPDLFREGQGVIAHGRMQDGMFVADEVLAKHDENYMPPEVAKSLKGGPHTTQTVEAAAAKGAGGAT
jgi:cytochrome c-type biogenesis protein CcmE